MDVFYYWKDHAADLKALRIGRFAASKDRLTELQDGHPNYIWAFKTPKGKKGQLQLLARLVWSDKGPMAASRARAGDSQMYYDPSHPGSVWFVDTDSEAAVAAVSDWAQRHFPSAVRSNFQGVNGQHAMRGTVNSELVQLSKTFATHPFEQLIPAAAT